MSFPGNRGDWPNFEPTKAVEPYLEAFISHRRFGEGLVAYIAVETNEVML